MIAQQPAALQLRYLQTLAEITGERNTTVVFPIPMDLIRPLMDGALQNSAPQPPSKT